MRLYFTISFLTLYVLLHAASFLSNAILALLFHNSLCRFFLLTLTDLHAYLALSIVHCFLNGSHICLKLLISSHLEIYYHYSILFHLANPDIFELHPSPTALCHFHPRFHTSIVLHNDMRCSVQVLSVSSQHSPDEAHFSLKALKLVLFLFYMNVSGMNPRSCFSSKLSTTTGSFQIHSCKTRIRRALT